VLHKQTQASPPPLFLSAEVLFLLRLCSSVLLELLLLDEFWLVVEVLLVELDEVELCFFSYSARSSLRFCSHCEFSGAFPFLNWHTFKVSLFPWIPRPTASSALHPLALVGAFNTWLGLSGFKTPLTSWHSD
jgi:hypothetical protein